MINRLSDLSRSSNYSTNRFSSNTDTTYANILDEGPLNLVIKDL